MLRFHPQPDNPFRPDALSSAGEQSMNVNHKTIDRLAAFIAVADSGSFTAAAERHELSKSSLSDAVAQLERELGQPLLQRNTRRLRVTAAGAEVLQDARELISRIETTLDRARARAASLNGSLRLTSPVDLAAVVGHWIAEYCALHPGMRVEYLPSDARLDLIEEGFDLALRVGRMRDSSLRAVPLGEFEMVLVAAPAYLAQRGVPREPADLAGHAWLAFSMMDRPDELELGGERVKLRTRISTNAVAALKSLALAGAGVAVAPEALVRPELAAGTLRRVLPDQPLPRAPFHALYAGRTPSAAARAFLDLIRDYAADVVRPAP